jgi:hypothetical protein
MHCNAPGRKASVGPSFGKYIKRVRLEDARKPWPGELRFIHGGCHPASILITPWSQLVEGKNPFIAVIDWEHSSNAGPGVNGDAANFVICLQVHFFYLGVMYGRERGKEVSAYRSPLGLAMFATRNFLHAFCGSYAHYSRFDLTLSPDNLTVKLLRSALIRYGRVLVDQLYMEYWADPKTVAPAALCRLRKLGFLYLDSAGASVEEMLEPENWAELTHVSDENPFRWIMKLFGFIDSLPGP